MVLALNRNTIAGHRTIFLARVKSAASATPRHRLHDSGLTAGPATLIHLKPPYAPSWPVQRVPRRAMGLGGASP
jgi:hypothetical protein